MLGDRGGRPGILFRICRVWRCYTDSLEEIWYSGTVLAVVGRVGSSVVGAETLKIQAQSFAWGKDCILLHVVLVRCAYGFQIGLGKIGLMNKNERIKAAQGKTVMQQFLYVKDLYQHAVQYHPNLSFVYYLHDFLQYLYTKWECILKSVVVIVQLASFFLSQWCVNLMVRLEFSDISKSKCRILFQCSLA